MYYYKEYNKQRTRLHTRLHNIVDFRFYPGDDMYCTTHYDRRTAEVFTEEDNSALIRQLSDVPTTDVVNARKETMLNHIKAQIKKNSKT